MSTMLLFFASCYGLLMALVNVSLDASCLKTILPWTILNEDDDRTTVRVLYGHVVAN